MKLFLTIALYMAVVLGFLYTSIKLFQMEHITAAWFSLIFAFLSIPSIKS